ncbi:MAG: hypothetical protein GY861_16580, partial [bacterium]|nr:hypothetical protein [bacterium]
MLFSRDVQTTRQVCGRCDHEDQGRCKSVGFVTEASKRLPKEGEDEDYDQSGVLYGVEVEIEHRCKRRHDFGLER